MNTVYSGIDFETAEQFGRRIAVALARGNWEQAESVVQEARRLHETETLRKKQVTDARRVNLCDTPIPHRLIGILEANGMFTVGDLLLVGLGHLAECKNVGTRSVDLIVKALVNMGMTRDELYGGRHV